MHDTSDSQETSLQNSFHVFSRPTESFSRPAVARPNPVGIRRQTRHNTTMLNNCTMKVESRSCNPPSPQMRNTFSIKKFSPENTHNSFHFCGRDSPDFSNLDLTMEKIASHDKISPVDSPSNENQNLLRIRCNSTSSYLRDVSSMTPNTKRFFGSKFNDYTASPSESTPSDPSAIDLHWIRNSSTTISNQRPQASIGSTLVSLGRKVYLYGGINKDGISNQLRVYKPFKDDWKILESGDLPPRSGHASTVIRNQIYVFGGETAEIKTSSISRCTRDLICYNPNLNQWISIKPSPKSKDMISPRKYAAICGYKDYLFILGGIDTFGVLLNDLWIFCLGNY